MVYNHWGRESNYCTGEVNLGNVQRGENETSYYGAAAEPREASYVAGKYEDSKKHSLGAVPSPPAAVGAFSHNNRNYGKDGYSVLPNNRSTTDQFCRFCEWGD